MIWSNVEGRCEGLLWCTFGFVHSEQIASLFLFYSTVPSRSKQDVSREISVCSRLLL
jgi:hypothetical protein